MAQYDLLLTQDVGVSVEFSEKRVHLNKGGLLTVDTNHLPVVLPVGADTYVLSAHADVGDGTGLEWVAQSAGHTQGTDTGTTSNTFTIDSDSTTGKIIIDVELNGGQDHTMTLTNAAMTEDVVITFPATTGTVAFAAQLHTQGTDAGTTGSVFDIDSDGTTNGVRLKAATGVLELKNLADNAYAALVSGGLTVNGALTVNGTTTTLNAVTLTVDDKNIELGSVAAVTGVSGTVSNAAATMTAMSTTVGLVPGMTLTKASGTGAFTGTPTIVSVDSVTQITMSANAATSGAIVTDFGGVTDVTADGGGITLKGATDKTIIWDNANDNWTLNQNVNIPSGTVYKINNSTVLSSTQVLGVTLGTMAAATATDYITKATYDAHSILYATSDDTPVVLTVGASTIVGRKASGNIVALTPAEAMNVLYVTAPADKIGTGVTSVAGQIAYDANFFYICTQSGSTGASKWARTSMATNWP